MSQRLIPNVVSIAGVDPSGGAGILADLKSFSALGAYGCGVVAALTAQNTQAVTGVHVPPTDFLKLQIDTLFADVKIHAVKLGMLGSAEIVHTVAERLAHWQAPYVVCDPVMVAKSGDHLLAKNAVSMLIEALLPQSFMITPNLPEAGVLLEQRAPETVKEMYRAVERLREMQPLSSERWVLLKGGHLPGNEVVDLLFDGDRMIEMPAPRIETKNTHGTGCSLSSAIAALLPQAGEFRRTENAVRAARDWLRGAIATSGSLQVGSGHGPVHHFHALWK
ncbi:bifunctional hydroxymethylpyrimidine kinase/phosphomethylpyrimidine kinase [Uliginosibacterium aquaticum]|uniref:hydroxymethylpyrimidine kinase n=1 Tax=Uliginosibacterium aquaticum TaxID=2731212 RepID=A0ABX2IHS6_9RHOO|nr:bifunctional hydroxymethylpyrimidine kinase/phosphomethylpyrimidine kinase [Uliginosibacterium aquaticum]NSL53575.1 bifunctional hydroxymethylpyrimidine kinase/phosphomethylpyrimidine kinase [Uliginosibacterium aquaticum]